MRIFDFLRRIKRKMSGHLPLIKVLIYKNNLLHNLHEYQNKFPKVKIAPVLKSNAYGHGLIPVAKILKNENVPFLVIDSLFEALALRSAGIKNKLLIIGYVRPEEIVKNEIKNIAITITGLEQLKKIKEAENKIKIHFKIDTGMHRQGVLISEIDEAINLIKKNENLALEGICSHFADADNKDKEFTEEQIKKWNSVVEKFKQNFSDITYFHISSSAGTFFLDKIECNLVRLGIGFYGFNLSPHIDLNLKPALEVRTIITGIKKIKSGEAVGYNATFTADKPMTIATVSAGYFEGIDRRLSNKGFVKINPVKFQHGASKFCPILGRVSMNIISIDVSEIPDIKIGDEVIVISKNLVDKNCAQNMAQICQTICYEILVHIPQHLKRQVV